MLITGDCLYFLISTTFAVDHGYYGLDHFSPYIRTIKFQKYIVKPTIHQIYKGKEVVMSSIFPIIIEKEKSSPCHPVAGLVVLARSYDLVWHSQLGFDVIPLDISNVTEN